MRISHKQFQVTERTRFCDRQTTDANGKHNVSPSGRDIIKSEIYIYWITFYYILLRKSGGQKNYLISLLLNKVFMNLCLYLSVAFTNSSKEIQNFLCLNKKLLYQLLPFFASVLCHFYTGGNHNGTTAIVASILRPKQNICVVPVARPCLILTPDPKHFCLSRIQNIFFCTFRTPDFFSGSSGFYLTRLYSTSRYQFSKQKWRRSYDHIVYWLAK